ncbi:MAG: hypothetical protein ACLVJ7_15470 [Acutalibacteraceae bacterium]
MPIWLEAALGLAAIALVAIACWREEKLVEWESRVTKKIKRRRKEESSWKRKSLTGRGHKPDRKWGDGQVIRF